MGEDSLEALEFKTISVIDHEDPEKKTEGTCRCECGKEFVYSVEYEENLRQVNGHLVFRCPRCFAMSRTQVAGVLMKAEAYEQKTSSDAKRQSV